MDRETSRQLVHIAAGVIFIVLLAVYGRAAVVVASFLSLIAGSLLINRKMLGQILGPLEGLYETLERKDTRMPGWGAAWYFFGILMASSFLYNPAHISSVIFIMAIGDGISTLIGRKGRHRLIYNDKKTVEGTLAMFLVSLVTYALIGPVAFLLSAIAAIVESIPWEIDDNLSIPLALIIALRLLA